MDSIIIILLLIIVIACIIYFALLNKNKINSKLRKKYKDKLKKILSQDDIRHKVIDLDSLLSKLFWTLWYNWSMWAKMKKIWNGFVNTDNIWYAHKVRNKLVHEIDFKLSEKESKNIISYYKTEFNKILN